MRLAITGEDTPESIAMFFGYRPGGTDPIVPRDNKRLNHPSSIRLSKRTIDHQLDWSRLAVLLANTYNPPKREFVIPEALNTDHWNPRVASVTEQQDLNVIFYMRETMADDKDLTVVHKVDWRARKGEDKDKIYDLWGLACEIILFQRLESMFASDRLEAR